VKYRQWFLCSALKPAGSNAWGAALSRTAEFFPCDYSIFSCSTYGYAITFFWLSSCTIGKPLALVCTEHCFSSACLVWLLTGLSVAQFLSNRPALSIQQGVVFFLFKYTQQKNSQTNLDSNFKTLCGPHLIHCLPLGRLQFLSWKGKLEGRKEGRNWKHVYGEVPIWAKTLPRVSECCMSDKFMGNLTFLGKPLRALISSTTNLMQEY